MDWRHYLDTVIAPVLLAMGGRFYSENACIMLAAIAAHESGNGKWVAQLESGPAAGLFQVEPDTARDCIHRYLLTKRRDLAEQISHGFLRVFGLPVGWPPDTDLGIRNALLRDRFLNVVIARVKLWMDPEPLPDLKKLTEHDAIWQAYQYYKRVYNTPEGAANYEQFKKHFPTELLT